MTIDITTDDVRDIIDVLTDYAMRDDLDTDLVLRINDIIRNLNESI